MMFVFRTIQIIQARRQKLPMHSQMLWRFLTTAFRTKNADQNQLQKMCSKLTIESLRAECYKTEYRNGDSLTCWRTCRRNDRESTSQPTSTCSTIKTSEKGKRSQRKKKMIEVRFEPTSLVVAQLSSANPSRVVRAARALPSRPIARRIRRR